MHLTDDDLVLHLYGESGPEASRIDAHLASCAACQEAITRLQQALALVDTVPGDEPAPGFEADVWARLQSHLEPPAPWWRQIVPGVGAPWITGGAIAALVIGAFLAGWFVRDVPPQTPATAVLAPDQAPVRTRVLLVAVGDHLQRSQMVLAALVNAGDAAYVNLSAERERASDLVAANRLFRQTAAMTGDGTLDDTLEELERVLLEIANGPADVSAGELNALRDRIEGRGMLFRIRVLSDEMRAREDGSATARQKGPIS
jgi:hypothetical protein